VVLPPIALVYSAIGIGRDRPRWPAIITLLISIGITVWILGRMGIVRC
jgi:hypothetical protein